MSRKRVYALRLADHVEALAASKNVIPLRTAWFGLHPVPLATSD